MICIRKANVPMQDITFAVRRGEEIVEMPSQNSERYQNNTLGRSKAKSTVCVVMLF